MSSSSASDQRQHWPDVARLWAQVGPPLRPSRADVEICRARVAAWSQIHGSPRPLILGVTPELHGLAWPAGTEVTAIDHTPAMIDAVWPGPREAVICAEWTATPLASGSRSMALCDGGLHLLPYPSGQAELARELARILSPGGLCFLRLFVPPPRREPPASVIADLVAGRLSNTNVLKFRLWMSLHESSEIGVELGQVWELVHRAAPDFDALARSIGWPPEQLAALSTYRDSKTRYHFVTEAQVQEMFCRGPGAFVADSVHYPNYELGQQCPTVILSRVAA